MIETGPAPAVTARPSGLRRLRLTEPVRLYLYSVALVLVAGLNLAGYLVGEWPAFAASSAAVLLGIPAGAEAARASVYSAPAVIAALRQGTDL